jgi:hypothetical protein
MRRNGLKKIPHNIYRFDREDTAHCSIPSLDPDNNWIFYTGQLFRGHAKFRRVYNTRNQVQLRDCVLRHVSAHGLMSIIAPTSLKHHMNMTSNDKCIWDAAYDEEFDGLTSLPTWEVDFMGQVSQFLGIEFTWK